MIHPQRMTALYDGEELVVFLIGMRINRLWRPQRWWPVAQAMPRMLAELQRQPERGLLHGEMWFGRTTLMLQYWRSMEQLLDYARARDAEHLPAWTAFRQRQGGDASVGIWHETYQLRAGQFENVYVNMPAFGLGRVGRLVEARGAYKSAQGRLQAGAQSQGAASLPAAGSASAAAAASGA